MTIQDLHQPVDPMPSTATPPATPAARPAHVLRHLTVAALVLVACVVAIVVAHDRQQRGAAEAHFLTSPLVTPLDLDRDTALARGYQACAGLTPATRGLSGQDDPVTFAAKLWLCGR